MEPTLRIRKDALVSRIYRQEKYVTSQNSSVNLQDTPFRKTAKISFAVDFRAELTSTTVSMREDLLVNDTIRFNTSR